MIIPIAMRDRPEVGRLERKGRKRRLRGRRGAILIGEMGIRWRRRMVQLIGREGQRRNLRAADILSPTNIPKDIRRENWDTRLISPTNIISQGENISIMLSIQERPNTIPRERIKSRIGSTGIILRELMASATQFIRSMGTIGTRATPMRIALAIRTTGRSAPA